MLPDNFILNTWCAVYHIPASLCYARARRLLLAASTRPGSSLPREINWFSDRSTTTKRTRAYSIRALIRWARNNAWDMQRHPSPSIIACRPCSHVPCRANPPPPPFLHFPDAKKPVMNNALGKDKRSNKEALSEVNVLENVGGIVWWPGLPELFFTQICWWCYRISGYTFFSLLWSMCHACMRLFLQYCKNKYLPVNNLRKFSFVQLSSCILIPLWLEFICTIYKRLYYLSCITAFR